MDDVTALRDALLERLTSDWDMDPWGDYEASKRRLEADLDALIAAVRAETLAGSGVVETPEQLEARAGRLLVEAGKARMARSGPDDAHEVRHLYAALLAGNSEDEEPGACRLDQPATPPTPARCSRCGVAIAEHPDTDACAIADEAGR